ncbi:MAG: hypothetical protein FWD54_06590 [Endomicrobia bacterium]|nr:hypothetical protein [Endomicrobiia bacterium]
MSDVSASITIDNTDITADNDLNIKTLADSQATAKAEAKNLALAAGVNLVESKINLSNNTKLEAGKDATVEAKSKITSDVEAKSDSGESFSGAIALSVTISDTSVNLDEGTINSGKDAKIAAVTEENIKTKAINEKAKTDDGGDQKPESGDGDGDKDTKIAIGIPVNYTDIKSNNEIKDAVIKADKNIDIAGKNIKIADSSIKSTNATEKGNVTIKAEDKGKELISTRKASIEISGSEIEGKDVTIEAIAENKYEYENTESIIEVSDLKSGILGGVNEILEVVKNITEDAVNGQIAMSDVSASITIDNTDITADNDLNIKTLADSQATAKAEAKNLALAAGVNLVESKIDISKTNLKGKNITAEAKSKIKSEVEAKSSSDEKYKGAIALSVADSNTSLKIDNDSTKKIEAGNDVTLSVITEKDIKTKAIAETPKEDKPAGGDGDKPETKPEVKAEGDGDKETKISLGVAVNYTDLKNDADIKSSITAGNNIKIASEGDNRRSVGDADLKIKADIIAGKSVDIAGKNIKIADSLIQADGTAESVEASEGVEAKEGDHIKIVASDKGSELISTRKASIDIQNTAIEGKRDVIIEAAAENKYDYKELGDIIEVTDLTDTALEAANKALDFVKDLTKGAIDGKVAKSDVSANINIGGGTTIKADNDINIKTSVESQTTVKTDAKGLGVSVGVNLTESKIDIDKATLEAKNDINVKAENKITSSVEAKSTSYDFGGTVELGGAVGVAYIEGETSINLSEDSSLDAGKNVAIDATTEKDTTLEVEAKAGEKANAGLAVGVNIAEVDNSVTVKGKVKAGNDVNINSKINSKKTKQNVAASTGNKKEEKDKDKEGEQKKNIDNTENSNLQDTTNKKSEGANDNADVKKKKDGGNDSNTITLAGAVLYTENTNTATAEISGPKAEVEAKNDINMKAEVINADITQFVESKVGGVSGTPTVSGTGAVVIGSYTDKVTAVVKDGAAIDAGKKINISSNHEMPFSSEWYDLFKKFADNPSLDTGKEVFEKLSKLTKEGEGTTEEKIITSLKDDLVNTWVRSSAPESEGEDNSQNNQGNNNSGGDNNNEKKQGGSSFSVSVAGAVNITEYDFTSEAYIKDAKVNQKTDAALRTGEQSVNVEAKSKTTSVTVGGIFGDSYKDPLGQGGSSVGVGGTYNQIWYDTKTNAYIEGTDLYANDLNVKANFDQLDVAIGIAGGKADTFCLQGVFNWLKSDSDVNAFIKDSDIKIETGNLTDGKLNIEAKYTPLLVNIAGSLSMSETAAVGASVAVNDITKNTNAKIIDSIINNSQNARLYALSDGLIHSYAIAAAYAGKDNSKNKNNQSENPDKNNMANKDSGTSEGSGDSGSFGIAISGSAGVSNITGETNAAIEGTNKTKSKYTGEKNLEIIAKEDSDIVNATGGVSITSPDADTGVAVAGAGSISWIKNNAKAYIKDSTVKNDDDITLDAKSEAGIVSVAVGLAGSFSSDGVAVAGSGSINLTDNETQAYIKNSDITSEGKLDINSSDKSKIFALAGAVGVAQGSAGIGAAIGVNLLDNNTSSYIENSDISLTGNASKNNISLDSKNSSNILSIAGAVGVGLGQVGVAVTVNVNVIKNETQSYIKGSGLESIKAQDILLSAKDSSDILAIAGAAGVGNNVGIGMGVGFNYLANSANAYIEDAKIENKGNIEAKALSESDIMLIVAALGGAGTVGISAAVGAAYVHNEANAYINKSFIVSEGSIGLLADNKNNITLISGSVAIGGTVAVGANVGLHFVGSRSNAWVDDSDVTAKGNKALSADFGTSLRGLSVNSNIYDKIATYSAAGSGSGTVAVSGGITGSIIDGKSIAKITNSTINDGYSAGTATQYDTNAGVRVNAENETEVAVMAGAVAVSGTVGVSVAADFETMNNTVEASIDNSTVKARGDVEVKTKNTEKYAAAIISGAVSGGVSVAGNVVVGVNTSENHAVIKNNSNITARDVTVEAKDSVIIGEVNPASGEIGIAMGSLAVGAYAGVAGTVFTSVISNSTIAEIVDSTINASRNIKLDAEGYQRTFANLATFGGAIAGIAITAGVSVNNTYTAALIRRSDNNTKTYNLNAQNININAKNTLDVDKIFIGGAVGVAGVTVGVSVGVYNNNVTAGMGSGIYANTSGNVGVSAVNDRNINDIVISMAGGFVGVTATVDVIVVGGNVNDNKLEEDDGTSTNTYLADSKNDIDGNMKMSSRMDKNKVGGGGLINTDEISEFDKYGSDVYTTAKLNNGTFAYIDGNVTAAGNVGVTATDNAKIDADIYAASAGVGAVGAAVAVQDLKTRTDAHIGGTVSASNINITANSDTTNATGIYMAAVGGVAVNAGVAVINSNNITNAYMLNNTNVTKANNINILANAKSTITPDFFNLAGGYIAVGAVVGVVNKKGSTDAWIGNNVTIGNQSAATPTVNGLTVKAQTNNKVDADMISAAGGVGAVAANIFVVNVTDDLNAYTGTGSKLNLYNLNVLTNGNTAVNADFVGVAVGAVAMAASVAVSNIKLNNNAYIGGNNTVKAENISVFAGHSASADLYAVGGSGGLIGANGIVLNDKISGTVKASVGKGSALNASKNINVSSKSDTVLRAKGDSITAGFVAVGVTVIKDEAAVDTITEIEDGVTASSGNSFYAGAESSSNLSSIGQSGGAGFGVIGGANVSTVNNSNTKITFGSSNVSQANKIDIKAANFTVNAVNKTRVESSISSLGLGAATVGIFKVGNDANSNVDVILGGNTNVLANNLSVKAFNEFVKPDTYSVKSGALSAIGIFYADSVTNISNNTNIKFAENSTVETYKNSEKTSSFIIDAHNVIDAPDNVHYDALALGSAVEMTSEINNNSTAKVQFDGNIYSAKDFIVNVRTDLDIRTNLYMGIGAAISGAQGKLFNNSVTNNEIAVGAKGKIFAGDDLYFNLNQDENQEWSRYSATAVGDIYNMAVIPIASGSKAIVDLTNNNKVTVANGGQVLSMRNIRIDSAVNERYVNAFCKELLTVYTPYGSTSLKSVLGGSVPIKHTSDVEVNGLMRAGVNNKQHITITQTGGEGEVEGPDDAQFFVDILNPEGVKWWQSVESLVDNIQADIENLQLLIAEYSEDPVLKAAYAADLRRLQDDLEKLGLFEMVVDDYGVEHKVYVNQIGAEYITFDEVYANRGDIIINADNLYGTGTLHAPGYAEIIITNNSRQYLRLGDVKISSYSNGDIWFNQVYVRNNSEISAVNKSKTAGFADVISREGSDNDPVIIINNNYSYRNNAPQLEISGDVENRDGLIKIDSMGSIYISGSIRGKELSITGGKDLVMSFYDGFRHLGGDPTTLIGGTAGDYEKLYQNSGIYSQRVVDNNIAVAGTSGPGKGIEMKSNIFISARYLNINGTIQAGVADWNLLIDNSPLSLINGHTVESAAAQYYSLKNQGTYADELYKLDSGYGNIDAWYNVVTGEIVVKDFSVDGGRIEILGTIFNTGEGNDVGRLIALDGYGQINIVNNSTYDLKLNSIYNDERVKGVITITDTSDKKKVNGMFLTTEYTFNNGSVYYNTYTTDDNGKRIAVQGLTLASQGIWDAKYQRYGSYYNPTPGLRYTWTSGHTSTSVTEYRASHRKFWGINHAYEVDWDVSGPYYGTPRPIMTGEYLDYGNVSSNKYEFGYSGVKNLSYKEEIIDWGTRVSHGLPPVFGYYTYHYYKIIRTGDIEYYSHSIKADYPIKINFIGYENPLLNVTSVNNIYLAGDIKNSNGNVNITSQQGFIDAKGSASISAQNLTLDAARGIAGGSRFGGGMQNIDASLINIKLNNGGILTANTISGNINLKSRESLVFSNIINTYGNVKLYAEHDLLGNTSGSKIQGKELDLTADGGRIGLKNNAGALLEINTSLINAYAKDNINLIKTETGDLGIKSIRSGIGDVNLTVSKGSVTDVLTDAIIDTRTRDELIRLWDSLGLFGEHDITETFDTGKVDEMGNAIYDEKVVGKSQAWTEDQLLYAMRSSKEGGTQYMEEDPNIVAKNVNIKTGGSVGINEGEIYFKVEDFSNLEESDKLLVATAEYYNVTWHTDENDKLTGITVRNQEDLNVHADKINIDAAGYVYLGAATDINIDQIKSGGNVTIKSKEGIYNISSGNNPTIIGDSVILEAGRGDIGELNKRIILDITGVLTARTPYGSIYLNSANNLSLDYLSAAKNVYIDANKNIYSAGYGAADDSNITAHSINLNAQNVGTAAKNLNVILRENSEMSDGKMINISAPGSIYVKNVGQSNSFDISGDLYYGKLTAGEYVSVMSKYGAIYEFDKDSLITAKNLILGASDNSIGTADDKIKADVKEIITAFAKGDIYIEAQNKGIFEDIRSTHGLVDISATENLYVDKVFADKNITITAANGSIETGTQSITSENGNILITGKDEVEVNAAIFAKKGNVEILSEENELYVTGNIVASEGTVVFLSEGKTEITGNVTADKDITADSKKELKVKGDMTSENGGVDLKSREKTDIEGAITAKETIKSLVKNGNLTIKGAVRSLEGNLNFKVLNGALIIGNKAVSNQGSILANVYGDITGDRTSVSEAGFYAGDVRLNSKNGDIGKPDNFLYIDNENPDFVIANLIALNGGIYVEGFTNGLIIERFWCGKDLFVIAGGDILAKSLGDQEPNVVAANITLHSLNGSIGKENLSPSLAAIIGKEDSRIIAAPIEEKGKVNLSAVTGIYLDQYVHTTFYSDYVRNSGKGKVSLLIPDNNAFIVDFSVLPGTDVNIRFVNNMHVKNVSLGYNDIKKLTVHPVAVWAPVFRTASEERYGILSNKNIEDYVEKMQNETLIISSNLLQEIGE